ncbi:MAG: hypothetical protein J4432_02575 [DPANN group archaeon]|nr:hypothetical protein [DPANN group archaeon]
MMKVKNLARFISWAFNALFVSLYVFLAVLLFGYGMPDWWVYFIVYLVFGFVGPALVIWREFKLGRIPDFHVFDQKKRNRIFAYGGLSYLLGGVFLLNLKAPFLVTSLLLIYFVNTFFMFLINLKYKSSVHMIGTAGPLVVLYHVFGLAALWLLPVVALVAWARYALKAHTGAQIALGTLLGFVLTWLELYYFFIPALG